VVGDTLYCKKAQKILRHDNELQSILLQLMIRGLAGKLQQKGYGIFREFFVVNKAASLLAKGKQLYKKTRIHN
jgi:hypothetical protein